MIVDCHCHTGTGDGLTGPWDSAAPIGEHLSRAAAAGIQRTIVFSVFHSDYARANAEVARVVARHPKRLLGFAFVHAERDAGRIRAMVARAVMQYGFRGIKLHRHDARITREVCEAARVFRVPVLYDVMGEVAPIEIFAREYADVDFIIPHLGSFADDWSAQLAFIDHLARWPNVYTDTSGVRRFDLLVEAVQRAGPEKVLFGSDGPWLHPGVELAKIRALPAGSAARALIAGGNVLRLLRRARAPRDEIAPGHVARDVGARGVATYAPSERISRPRRARRLRHVGALMTPRRS